MHVHVPKPLHGWKAFSNEIFVIVIGVLIALGLEQVAENIHWKHKVAEGEERLREEALDNFVKAAQQVMLAPCVQAQYDRLSDRIVASGDRLEPAPRLSVAPNYRLFKTRGRVIAANFNNTQSTVWRELEQDGTTLHMPADRHRKFADLYGLVDIYNEQMSQGFFPPEALAYPLLLDASARAALLLRVDDNARRFANMENRGMQIMAAIRDLGLAPDVAVVDERLAGERPYYQFLIEYCAAHHYPLADWKVILAPQPAPAKGDPKRSS